MLLECDENDTVLITKEFNCVGKNISVGDKIKFRQTMKILISKASQKQQPKRQQNTITLNINGNEHEMLLKIYSKSDTTTQQIEPVQEYIINLKIKNNKY